MKYSRQLLVYLFFTTLYASPLWAQDFLPQVVAPLLVKDIDAFNVNLQKTRKIGIKAVSVDVWWGIVERNGDNQFDINGAANVSPDCKAQLRRPALPLLFLPTEKLPSCGNNYIYIIADE
jgi:hypothetical protein